MTLSDRIGGPALATDLTGLRATKFLAGFYTVRALDCVR
jgi:hypothetical protein